MKLLHVVPSYLPAVRYGGPIYSVHALCAALAARGHDVDVYTTNADGAGISDVPVGVRVLRDGVAVTYFPTGAGRRLFRSPAMRAALAANVRTFDIVHTHSVFLWPTLAAARAARRFGIPYVMSPRGMLVGDLIQRKSSFLKRAWIALFERRNLAAAAAVHATSELEATEIQRLQLPFQTMRIIPNGIDYPAAAPPPPPPPPQGEARLPVILSLGRLNWKKRLDLLIEALPHVPQARLIIAGNDEERCRARLEQLAQRLGVGHRVEFAGPVYGADKWRLLARADLFALLSHSENFGNAALEAMAAGVPVVTCSAVGIAGAVRREGAGVVVDGDAAMVGAAMASLLADPAERQRMSAAGRRAARELFSWPAIAASMEDLYRQAKGAA